MQKSIIFFAVAAIFIVQSEALHQVKSEADFDKQVKNAGNKLVVVDFYATWCSPCHYIAPHLEKLAKRYAGKVEIIEVGVDELESIAVDRYHVKSMPTFVFLKNGKVVKRFSGANPAKIERTIDQLTRN